MRAWSLKEKKYFVLKRTRREVRQCDGISISNAQIYYGHTSDITLAKATIRKDSFLFQEEHFNTIAVKRTRGPSLSAFSRVLGEVILLMVLVKAHFRDAFHPTGLFSPVFAALKRLFLLN